MKYEDYRREAPVRNECPHGTPLMLRCSKCLPPDDVPLTNWLTKPRSVYVIGSLRNPDLPGIAEDIRERTGLYVFDDWYSAGPEADDYWKRYEQERGHDYITALSNPAAKNVYEFDKRHLDAATDVVLVLPAGKSGHLELGYCVGKGKRTYILLEADTDPRWDVMYQFANHVVSHIGELVEKMDVVKA